MKVKEHPDYPRLEAAMKRGARYVLSWAGVIYRSAPPKWAAGRDMLTGAGSMKAGARFNSAETFPAIYGSTTPELAMIESLAFQRRAGLPVEQALPLVVNCVIVKSSIGAASDAASDAAGGAARRVSAIAPATASTRTITAATAAPR